MLGLGLGLALALALALAIQTGAAIVCYLRTLHHLRGHREAMLEQLNVQTALNRHYMDALAIASARMARLEERVFGVAAVRVAEPKETVQ